MSDNLNLAKLELFNRLYEQVNNAKDRAICFYGKEATRLGLTWNNRTWHDGNIIDVDYCGIDVKWDEYARSCHVAGGTVSISYIALADDTYQKYVTDLVEKQLSDQNAEHERKLSRELSFKQAQLAKLKAELGET